MRTRTTLKRRLNELELRRRLRARPRLQGRILAPAGIFKRLPDTAGLYFPFYHDVPAEFAGDLRRHLRAFRQRGPLVSWHQALGILAGKDAPEKPVFCLSFDDGHLSWRDVVAPILAAERIPATFFLTTGLVGRPGNLTWDDCRDLAAQGFAFGSHTITHHRLADQSGFEVVREIADSKHEIEDELGVAVDDFAAPYGHPVVDFGEREVTAAREAGYRSFATTLRAAMHPGGPPMAIRRQGLHPAWPLWAVRTRVHA
ncbi:polysaccharide deacetylase family protein [Actinoplanes sp. NPDC049596]|uniref:polysaccharide deacetylase family protein n=1 Tax=unclassified Actinoplanes TaxID=2626549 RepID=UPI00343A8540